MIAFRCRKRKAAPAGEVPSKKVDVTPTPTPRAETKQHPVAAFANTVYVDPVIKSIYRYVDKKTFLNWGLTSDWQVEGPRRRTSPSLSLPIYASPRKAKAAPASADADFALAPPTPEKEPTETPTYEDPNASSEGYGEMTEGSVERMLLFLKNLDDHPEVARLKEVERLTKERKNPPTKNTKNTGPPDPDPDPEPATRNLTPSSSFIDVGSGYGKVVLHAKLSARVNRAVGIEYVPQRARMASDALEELRSGRRGFVTPLALAALRDDSTSLRQGDATKYGQFDFTHVYMYDKVFSDPTTELLAAQLNASETTRVLVSYQRFEQWHRLGLKKFIEVASLTMRTTGGQNFKAYVLVNTR